MLHHTDLLAHARDRQQELIAEADRYRLAMIARQRSRAPATRRVPAHRRRVPTVTGEAGLAASG